MLKSMNKPASSAAPVRADRSAQMTALARAFGDAAAVGNWQRVAELAGALPAQLQAWAGTPLTRAERQALTALRAAHDGAALTGTAALDLIDGQLAAIRNNKDGYLAYALAGDTETT